MGVEQHFKKIAEEAKKCYEVANKARAKGYDPVSFVETPIASSLAEKVVGLISIIYPQLNDKKVINRILELEKEYGQLDTAVAFEIAEEISKEKFCKFENLLQAIDAGIRIGFAYITLGVVSSPIEGYTGLKTGKTKNGEDYFIAYFSGPIRSAGTTAGCVVLMLIDYLREIFGFAKYDPDEDEVKRYVTENYDYHEYVSNLQYLPTEEEIAYLAKNLPIQISGEPTTRREVSNYKDLPRVETNFIRGGMCLIFSEGLAQKAQKGLRLWKDVKSKGFKCSGWDYLEGYLGLHKKREKGTKESSPVYIKDLVAGRPVFSHPSRSGGFRFRYGIGRTGGFSAALVHPATMAISNSFLSSGTQLKIEKPTKGCAITVCDEIDGPIVKFKDGTVKKINNFFEAKKAYREVDEIIYLGDILFPLGDIINRNFELLSPGYVEEWWALEVEKAMGKALSFNKFEVDFKKALEISEKYGIPLHPNYIFYWTQINYKDFLSLIDWLAHGHLADGKLILPFFLKDKERFYSGKRALELIGCEHKVIIEHVVVDDKNATALLFNLGLDISNLSKDNFEELIDESIKRIKETNSENILEVINKLCRVKIKDKAGTFIGARMGRPEKAKLRKLTGSPHALFPVGEEGGRLRSFQAAMEVGHISAEAPTFRCNKCLIDTIYPRCDSCGEICERIEEDGLNFQKQRIDIRHYFEKAKKMAGVNGAEVPILKGVRGTSSKEHSIEHLAKGLLRARHNLNVNKDGTIRYDMTEMSITHFKPKEIGTAIQKLKELGYEKDIDGKILENDEQILELFPHDIILPACPDTLDEKADDVFLRIAGFVDDELEKIYNLPKFYNAEKRGDIVGALAACIAPHICTASIARIIGFSKIQALLASPFMHAAMRRDCLGFDDYVSVEEKGEWKIEKIGEYIEKLKPADKADSFGTLAKKTLGVFTFGNPGKGEVVEATKHLPRKMLGFYLEDGRKIEATENHRFYLKGKIEKRASELKAGDKLIVNYKREIAEKKIDEIFLPEIFKNRSDVMIRNVRQFLEKFGKMSKHENYCFRDSFPIVFVRELLEKNGKTLNDLPPKATIGVKRDNISLPMRLYLSRELLEVIGLYVAEGYLRKREGKKGFYQISIAGNSEIRGLVKKVFYSHFGLKASYENNDGVTFSSKIVYELFKEYLMAGERAKEKRIPSRFLNLEKHKLAAFLRGYFEGDGSVSLSDIRVVCDSVSEGLKQDISFALSRFGIYTKFYEYKKEPGEKIKQFYIRKGREIPKFKITKIIIPSNFVRKFQEVGFISERKKRILEKICNSNPYGMRIDFDGDYAYPKIVKIEEAGEKASYCFNVSSEHNFFANDILVHNCDGDEAAAMLLMDLLLNFSKKFLPAHRGGTQDSPLVLNVHIRAGEVDDQILDFVLEKYPLELYEMAEQGRHSSEIKIENVRTRLKEGKNPFSCIEFTHGCSDFNAGVVNSSYKVLPTMEEKVNEMMGLCAKIRAVDVNDVARLVIERHFIRDTKGNLRKFSMQVFRCVTCNKKFRRPPLVGKCTKCGGRIIFTISEGSIIKYMQLSLDLAKKYKVSPYLLESLELTEMYIQSIFGKEKEIQEPLNKWFSS